MAAGLTPREHALDVLEFGRVLEAVAGQASSEEGARRVRDLAPSTSRPEVRRALDAVDEVRGLLERPEGWSLGPIPSLGSVLGRLRLDGSVLEPAEAIACGTAMGTARAARRAADDVSPDGLCAEWMGRLWGDRRLEERIRATFDDAGGVADDASPELSRIRRALVDRRARLVRRLERYASELPERIRVPDASVTIRNGRYCIPVRREGKGSVGGLVHDASSSRQTLFVEPSSAIDEMNEIRELELAEAREVQRILRELSDALRAHHEAMQGSFEALVELDALRARARFASELDGAAPEFLEPGEGGLAIRGASHPLLALGRGAVPFDLDLARDERVLLVSGPNAGGKTVLLKTIGLIGALAQSGVIPPVRTGTRLPFFQGYFAIIGDEQSIDASLSTFGAQARNLAEILNGAGEDDLVLIDEIGSATDPAEGGALAAAALDRLSGQARLTVATTHLGDLKRLGEENPATVNASLQFDPRRLEPTFRLVRDRPGRSYALEIAARLGIPEEVLEDARGRLDADHLSLDATLDRLDRERAEAEALRSELETRAAELERRLRVVEEREEEASAREREAEREREEARRDLLREERERVSAAIEELERQYAASAGGEARREARREARDVVEGSLREAGEALSALESGRPEAPSPSLSPGDTVRWSGSRRPGELVEVRGTRAVVEVDGVRLTLPVGDLSAGAGEARPPVSRPGPRGEAGGDGLPDLEARTEIDLRGLRVDEIEGVLLPALDAALVAELPFLRIIHGKGTGALRERVRTLLGEDPRAPAFRSGEPEEGGAGVTVVELQ